MTLRRWIALAVGLVAAIGIIAAAYVVTQPRAQIAALPTLAILPTATASLTPTDPPTHSPTPVIVVEIVTATPLPSTATLTPSMTASATPTFTATAVPSATITDTQTPALTSPAPTLAPPTPTINSTDAVQPISPKTYFVTVGSANMRACPRRDCAIVAPLMRGDPVTVVGYAVGDAVSSSNIWFSVHLLTYQGFVHSSLLALTMPATVTFTPAPVQIYSPPTAPPSGSGIVCADGTMSSAQTTSGACSYHGGIAGSGASTSSGSGASSSSSSGSTDSSGGFTCADGSISHAAHRQGACSHHGGIAPGS